MKIRNRHIAFSVLGAILVLVGWAVYKRVTDPAKANAQGGGRGGAAAVAVEVSNVSEETIRDVGNFSGSLQARSKYVLSPKIGGRLVRLYADVGDRVLRGQVLAQLDDTEYVQQLEQAKADLEVTAANLEDAKGNLATQAREFERVKTLFQSKIASQTELDQTENQFRKTEAQLKVVQAQMKQKEAALETARVRLSYTKLLAEWESPEQSRVIGERFTEEGALLKANDSVLSVMDIGSLTATINVTESVYPKMKSGLPARIFSDAYAGAVFSGSIQRVAPFLNEATRQAEVRLEVPNPRGELKPGLFVRISIEYGKKEKARVVPAAALVKRNDRDGVFLVDREGPRVKFVPVTLGVSDGVKAEILTPANLNGAVVVLGQHLLIDGSRITLPVNGSSKDRTSGGPNLGGRGREGSSETGTAGKDRSETKGAGAPPQTRKQESAGTGG